jgi:ComEC/Rec2-related protein
MITRNRIIFFCYMYIVGIALAMVAPLDPVHLPKLSVAAGVALAALTVHAWLSGGGRTRRASIVLWVLMFAAAVALGYARHTAANTAPDMRIGEVRLGPGGGLHLNAELPDASRLRWHKEQALEADVKLRLIGEVDARRPVTDESGAATMDEDGRWRFTMLRQGVTSDVVTVHARDAVGADHVVPQPFTRIHRVELIDGPSDGVVGLYRISNHTGAFSKPGRGQSPVKILGRITGDPLVYDFKTVLPITPRYIQYPAGGPFYRVEGGDVHVTVKPEIEGYDRFARTDAYGYDVEVEGELTVARGAANPGGFDARRFMQNYNIFGLMNLFQAPGRPAPIRTVSPAGGGPRTGSGLVEFSLDLRDRVLRVFKITMPYPQSAFLGGVTLGLRYGLPATPCVLHGAEGQGCEDLVVDEFKAAGVNHVLAVSGLHVTIVTVMFIGIFTLLRIPRQAFVPLIMLALVVFAIITGARPSTLRAVIMNSLFLLTWAYMAQGLRSSALLGVPVAAFMILLQNPLVVVDPSFTLSFGAILSLALLTGPFQDVLMTLRGNRFAVFIAASVAATLVGVFHWALAVTPTFMILFAALTAIVFIVAGRLQARGIGLPETFSYGALPSGVSTFLAAQFGIQVGMMIPLSAYYFCRWPFAGAYANLIAIPLIGVVVQLAAIGGLIGILPGIGLWLALLLNAANWLSASLFMWLAHISAKYFPYPFVTRPGLGWLVTYYAFCAVFVWRRELWAWWKSLRGRGGPWSPRAAATSAALALCVLTLPVWLEPPRHRAGELRLSFLAVGYGSSVLVETPGGRNLLVDAGFVEHERGRRNEAIRTILPHLSHRGIRHLDALILLSPLPERTAGASCVLDHIWTDYLFLPPALEGLSNRTTPDQLTGRVGLPAGDPRAATMFDELVANTRHARRPTLVSSLGKRADTWVNRWADWQVGVRTLRAGAVLFEEQTAGGPFRIEVLHPAAGDALPRPGENESLVLRIVHGDFAALLTGDLREEGLRALLDRQAANRLAAQFLVLPNRGTAAPADAREGLKTATLAMAGRSLAPLLDRVKPEYVLFEFGNPRPVLADAGRDARRIHEIVRRYVADRIAPAHVLSTDSDMAVVVTSDGRAWQVETQARHGRSESGAEDAVSDIAVGL